MMLTQFDVSTSDAQIERLGRSTWRLTTRVLLPKPRREVFQFFAEAVNLQKVTPEFLNFRILTPLPIDMREGALIDYRIRLWGIPIKWRTRISDWRPHERFVDEQIRGPYRQWHHEHIFEDHGDQTLMTDIVNYRVWLGAVLHPLIVKRDLTRIFRYRRTRIVEIFAD